MTTRRKPPARREEPRGLSPAGVVVVVAVLAAAAGGWYLWTRENRVATTLELQQRLLADQLSGRQARLVIDRIIRHVDTMSPAQVEHVRESVRTAIRQLHQASMDAYFAAPLTDKQAVLDKAIDREALLGELRFAVGNNSYGARRRPAQTPAADPRPGSATAAPAAQEDQDLAKLRRELSAKYVAALSARAKERGIALNVNRRRW
jgi:DNA-binding transcriptional regulator of glucitol operon